MSKEISLVAGHPKQRGIQSDGCRPLPHLQRHRLERDEFEQGRQCFGCLDLVPTASVVVGTSGAERVA